MSKAIAQRKPDKTFIITFDIKENTGTPYTLVEKIDILRRWVLFAVAYGEYLPRVNMWWFFSENNRKPYCLREDQNTHKFYTSPVKIEHGPKGIKSDWEFNVDPFTIHKACTHGPFKNINNQLTCPIELLFKSEKKSNGDLAYKLYDIGCDELNCQAENACTTCQKISKKTHPLHDF